MSHFFTRPSRSQFRMKAVDTPETMLLPARLFSTRRPPASRMSLSMLDTVVLPLVPVTATMVLGLPT